MQIYQQEFFLDLSNAFDTLDHEIKKLHYYWNEFTELAWFKAYFTDRKQYVHFDGINSNILHVTTGFTQGSILGPLSFIICMNKHSYAILLAQIWPAEFVHFKYNDTHQVKWHPFYKWWMISWNSFKYC